MKKHFKQIGQGLLVLFPLIQFFRPAKNLSSDTTPDISTRFPVPPPRRPFPKPPATIATATRPIIPGMRKYSLWPGGWPSTSAKA